MTSTGYFRLEDSATHWSGAGPHTIEIYQVTGGGILVGFESDSSVWTLIDTVIVVSSGSGSSTTLPPDFEVNIPVG
ncbi:MAG: hypothetical protein ACI97A_002436 [Planctomycetota bacterium]|jgi:hypothetical protein